LIEKLAMSIWLAGRISRPKQIRTSKTRIFEWKHAHVYGFLSFLWIWFDSECPLPSIYIQTTKEIFFWRSKVVCRKLIGQIERQTRLRKLLYAFKFPSSLGFFFIHKFNIKRFKGTIKWLFLIVYLVHRVHTFFIQNALVIVPYAYF